MKWESTDSLIAAILDTEFMGYKNDWGMPPAWVDWIMGNILKDYAVVFLKRTKQKQPSATQPSSQGSPQEYRRGE